MLLTLTNVLIWLTSSSLKSSVGCYDNLQVIASKSVQLWLAKLTQDDPLHVCSTTFINRHRWQFALPVMRRLIYPTSYISYKQSALPRIRLRKRPLPDDLNIIACCPLLPLVPHGALLVGLRKLFGRSIIVCMNKIPALCRLI